MGQRVEKRKTPVSDSEMSDALVYAWKELFKTTPTQEQIALVMAQNSLETGARKSMWNYNVGNLTTTENSSYKYFDTLKTKEQIEPGKWVESYLKYRAYDSLKEGALDYLKFISGKRYANAWQHILNPNPQAFSKELKRSKYYTANESEYTKGITSLYEKYTGKKTMPTQDTKEDLNKYFGKYDLDGLKMLDDHFKKEIPKASPVALPSPIKKNQPTEIPLDSVDSILDQFLQKAASQNKKTYKVLPSNVFTIKINSNDTLNSIEYSRILSMALDEELLSTSSIHSDGNNVEIECVIHGPKKECFAAIEEVTSSISEAFSIATKKIGSIQIDATVRNKKSTIKELPVKVACANYHAFISKFV